MRFSFDADQRAFADAVRDLLARECTPAAVRESWESETGRSTPRWQKLAAMGVTGLTVPERYGGLGMDEVGLVLLLEEAGWAGLPEPVVETVAVGVPLLVEAAPEHLAKEWLGRVASGDALLTVGLESQPYVADAHQADLLLLEGAGELHAVSRSDVGLTAQPSVDGSRRLFAVTWSAHPSTCIAVGEPARLASAAAFDRAALATAAQLLGVSERLIDMTAGYARERRQFGKPIGSFQAVKHHLAGALLDLELAKPAVYRAAWSVAQDEPARALDVSLAKAYASVAAAKAARVALQVHGAIGYTWECDIHLWMKRAWTLAGAWGDAAWHRRRIAASVIGSPVRRPGTL